jgi:hypothetical protein
MELDLKMNVYNIEMTKNFLKGPTIEQIISCNQWAATAFDKYHKNSRAEISFNLDGEPTNAILEWDSKFSKKAMREEIDMANHGGVALAWFVMSVLLDYGYVEQSEIGDGVDYRFKKTEPDDDELNFLDDYHYVEISGILQESRTNTLMGRIKDKHAQISRGSKYNKTSSVIVTLFSQPKTVKEKHL